LYFLNFDPDAEELVDYLADAKDYIDLILLDPTPNGVHIIEGTNLYGIKANWKLLCENAVDGYHGVALHSTYFDYLSSYGASGEVPNAGEDWVTVRDLGNGHTTLDYPNMGLPRPVAYWHPLFGEDTKDEIAEIEREVIERLGPERANHVCHHGKNMLIFPNLVIADGPGMTIRTIWTVTPDYMEVTAWALAGNGETPEQIRRRVDMFVTFLGPGGMASPDDVEAIEACQDAFKTQKELPWSDVSRGMHRQATMFDELQMRVFWRAWRARLQGGRPAGQIPVGGSEREPADVAG
jgi:p-cumate 2,3-dioxygenase alpha subunit